MHAKRPGVTKGIEHGSTRRYQGVQGEMVIHLVEVKTGLVTSCQIHAEGQPMLLHLYRGGKRRIQEPMAQFQTVVTAYTQVITEIDLLEAG